MKKSFTLIELLIVVVIIGIISSLAIPEYQKFKRKTEYVDAITALNLLNKAVNYYHQVNGTWPPDGGDGSYWDWTKTGQEDGVNRYLKANGMDFFQLSPGMLRNFSIDIYQGGPEVMDEPDDGTNYRAVIIMFHKDHLPYTPNGNWGILIHIRSCQIRTNPLPRYYP